MRELSVRQIEDAVCELFQTANRKLPCDLAARIADAAQAETEALPRAVMEDIAANLTAADEMHVPICQDTGMAVLFCDLGQDVHLVGGDFAEAVNRGVARAYRDGYLRRRPGGEEEVREYYRIAPRIVEAVNARENAGEIWARVYEEMVLPCVRMIRSGAMEDAFRLYKEYTLKLASN